MAISQSVMLPVYFFYFFDGCFDSFVIYNDIVRYNKMKKIKITLAFFAFIWYTNNYMIVK